MYILKPTKSTDTAPLKYYSTIEEAADYLTRHWLAIPTKGLWPHEVEYCQQNHLLSVYCDYTDEGKYEKQTHRYRVIYLSGVNDVVEAV